MHVTRRHLEEPSKNSPGAQLAELGGGTDKEHGPAVGGESKVHVVNGQLKVAQIAILGQRQELGARRDWHPRQELVRVVLALLDYQLALDLLELPQEHQAGHHVRGHHVQVAEEVAQQPGNVGERVLRAIFLSGLAWKSFSPVLDLTF